MKLLHFNYIFNTKNKVFAALNAIHNDIPTTVGIKKAKKVQTKVKLYHDKK